MVWPGGTFCSYSYKIGVISLFINCGGVSRGPSHAPLALTVPAHAVHLYLLPEDFLWPQDFLSLGELRCPAKAANQRWAAVVGDYVSFLASLGDNSVLCCVPRMTESQLPVAVLAH